jgi:2-C-methyl-D-erythritol 4-phosphate cytidylyltransferase
MNIALIVAGGQGLRMKRAERKQYLDLDGTPVLGRTLAVFDASDLIDRIVLVVPELDSSFCRDDFISGGELEKPVDIVAGGQTRQASVFNGLRAIVAEDDDLVAIHDAVRPFLKKKDLEACIRAADETGACILGLRAFDTVKKADSAGRIEATVDRDSIWLAQTPQVFRYRLIIDAHTLARQKGIAGTDDAALLEMAGHAVRILPGSRLNIKITTPEDLALAGAILKMKLI